jgi:benzoyl-CoA reductase/2-hydroxyglutaryl-CoA dehydratase subunit BcrC/BadD/HgdB
MSRALEALREALSRRPEEIAQAKRSGSKVVGYYCCYAPVELIHALGLIPIRLGWGGNDELAEDGIPYITNIQCPFVRQSIGVFKSGKNPYAEQTDLVAIAAVCLQEYRMTEVLRIYFKKQTLTLSVPKNFYLPEGREFFVKELAWFTGELEKFSGNTLDGGKLKDSIQLFSDIRAAVAKLYGLLAEESSPVTWREVFEAIQAGFYLEPVLYLGILKDWIQEIEQSPRPVPVATRRGSQVRVVLAGSILAPGDTKVLDVLDAQGVTVVADDTCAGQRTFADLTIQEPTLQGIAEGYLNKVPCAAQLYPFRETDKRLQNLFRLVEEHRADAVVYHTIRFCDPYTFRYEENKDIFDEKGIPFLQVHTDYGKADVGQLATRIGALAEIVKQKKKTRAEGVGV